MTPAETAKYLFNRLIAAGLTTEGACAILGNVQAESGFLSNNLEDSRNIRLGMSDAEYTAAVDNGSYTLFTSDDCGYGLAQWTFGKRKEKLLKYMKNLGKSIGDLNGQIDFLIKEFQEDFLSLWSQLKSSKDLYNLTWILLDKWENPQVKNISTRYQYAQNWFNTLHNNPGSGKVTENQAIEKVLDLARSEIGYKEKRSNAQLDNKDANAGSGNWTKYARDLDAVTNFYNGAKNGFSWCDIFVDWLFYQCFGAQTAMQMLCQPTRSAGAGCLYSAGYYRSAGRWTNNPAPGEQIFFISGGDVYHTGIVEEVKGNQIITIEGNSGDQVARRVYSINDGRIYGYGIPRWSYATGSNSAPVPSTPSTSYGKSILQYGSKGAEVRNVQQNLIKLGYACGPSGADGDFGTGTLNAVRAFQRDNDLTPDGKVGPATYAAIDAALQARTSEAPKPSNSSKTYTVKKGDTLWGIAASQLGSGPRYTEIKKLNGLTSNLIKVGQVLRLP